MSSLARKPLVLRIGSNDLRYSVSNPTFGLTLSASAVRDSCLRFVDISLKNDSDEEIHLGYDFLLMNSFGNVILDGSGCQAITRTLRGRQSLSHPATFRIHNDEEFTVVCDFEIRPENSGSTFGGLAWYRDNPDSCDAVIKCAGWSFPCHSQVVGHFSQKLYGQFGDRSGIKEIEIFEFKDNTIGLMLEFMYMGRIDWTRIEGIRKLIKMTAELIELAKRYNVAGLDGAISELN